jgi:hypothetical protein
MLKSRPHPDQLPLGFGKDAEIERMIEARVAIRAEAAAIRWRFRLVILETVMMSSLVIAAGVALGQPTWLVVRGAVVVGITGLATGLLLIALSGATGILISKFRRWRAR